MEEKEDMNLDEKSCEILESWTMLKEPEADDEGVEPKIM